MRTYAVWGSQRKMFWFLFIIFVVGSHNFSLYECYNSLTRNNYQAGTCGAYGLAALFIVHAIPRTSSVIQVKTGLTFRLIWLKLICSNWDAPTCFK